ncbi:hypothetical protein NDU88_003312 [Pleurodeles waltl]|uniref:Uncharacterized protein n=1 Tax=Pleurodeles waltl TaxID=8319 RepID=A0AAV7UY38_PLEWA|nr:hypothetical protein NDU88_003312 [Pleurodeles waltl]
MPGRSSLAVSFSSVDSSLSSLKNCQAYINTGMEIATNVALDLLETESDEGEVKNMENVMLDYAAMDRELNQFIQAVEDITNQVRREQLEKIPDLKALVKDRFAELQSRNTDLDLQRNVRFKQFKEQLRETGKQPSYLLENRGAGQRSFMSKDTRLIKSFSISTLPHLFAHQWDETKISFLVLNTILPGEFVTRFLLKTLLFAYFTRLTVYCNNRDL